MSYKSEESKVYQGLNLSRKVSCVFRSEHNVGDIYSYMENINYFFDKDDKPIDRMETLMYLIALMTSFLYCTCYGGRKDRWCYAFAHH